jgi:uncharacterized MAPEG superfamily protein
LEVPLPVQNSLASAPELHWLVLTLVMTALFWVPYVLNRIAERGLWTVLKNPRTEAASRAEWATRMAAAHANAVENLVLFAPLVLVAVLVHGSTALTAMAAAVYFFARLAHFIVYSLGVPVLRTLAFAVGWAAAMAIALDILGIIG